MMDTVYVPLVVAAGAAANLLIAAMFAARVVAPRRSRPLGFAGTAMAIPLSVACLIAFDSGADVWLIVLPAVFVAFAVIELVVDLLLPVDVRATRWLWPYLAAFYLAQWAVIGAAFLANTLGGATVLVTYFICLAATGWSYREVGHGEDRGLRGAQAAGVSRTSTSRKREQP